MAPRSGGKPVNNAFLNRRSPDRRKAMQSRPTLISMAEISQPHSKRYRLKKARKASHLFGPSIATFEDRARRKLWRNQNMIRKLADGHFRLYSRKKDAKTGRRRNLGTFDSLAAAQKHERAVQYFKRQG
jgi:hypothetical protein